MVVPAWVSCVLYLCALAATPSLPGVPLSWLPAWSQPHSLLSAAQLLFVRETATKTLKGWSESRGENANLYFSSLASIFAVKETENKSYLLQNPGLPCILNELSQVMSTSMRCAGQHQVLAPQFLHFNSGSIMEKPQNQENNQPKKTINKTP